MTDRNVYEFASFRFEPFNARLVWGGEAFPLTWKASETLLALVRQPDTIVSQDELMSAVWPDVAVELNNLSQQIAVVRRMLARDPRVVIETIPRRGYRLKGPVRVVPATAGAMSPVPSASPSPDDAWLQSRRARSWLLAGALVLVIGVSTVSPGANRATSLSPTKPSKQRVLSDAARERGNQLHREGNNRGAVSELQEAVRIDPTNARAYSSLAHALQALSSDTPSSAVRPVGESPIVEAARRAVELDPGCGECQGTYALFLFYDDWKFKQAETRFLEAMRLAPNSTAIPPAYAMLLAISGRPDEAVRQVDIGLAADPYRSSWLSIRASALYFGRRYDEAIATADRALAISNHDRAAWDWRSKALFQVGRGREALLALAQDLFADHSIDLDHAVRDGGVEGGLRKALELTDDWRGRIEHAWRRAGWRAMLGDNDGTLDELERAFEMRRFNAINLGADPMYDKVRDHPRFRKVLDKIGLAEWFPPAR